MDRPKVGLGSAARPLQAKRPGKRLDPFGFFFCEFVGFLGFQVFSGVCWRCQDNFIWHYATSKRTYRRKQWKQKPSEPAAVKLSTDSFCLFLFSLWEIPGGYSSGRSQRLCVNNSFLLCVSWTLLWTILSICIIVGNTQLETPLRRIGEMLPYETTSTSPWCDPRLTYCYWSGRYKLERRWLRPFGLLQVLHAHGRWEIDPLRTWAAELKKEDPWTMCDNPVWSDCHASKLWKT